MLTRPLTSVIQGVQDPQLVHGVNDVVAGGRVHPTKVENVVHFQALEQQHDVREVGPLDLGHRHGQHLVSVRCLCVQPAICQKKQEVKSNKRHIIDKKNQTMKQHNISQSKLTYHTVK